MRTKRVLWPILLAVALLMIVGCTPEPVASLREVIREVTVVVTREVAVVATRVVWATVVVVREVPIEVTRQVPVNVFIDRDVVVTTTPQPTATLTATPTPTAVSLPQTGRVCRDCNQFLPVVVGGSESPVAPTVVPYPPTPTPWLFPPRRPTPIRRRPTVPYL